MKNKIMSEIELTRATSKGKKTLLLILAVSVTPIAAAYFMFFTGIGVPDHTVNAGRLISPANHVTEILVDGNDTVLQHIRDKKKWRIFIPVTQPCGDACQQNLVVTRQVHIRLADKSNRVERYAINLAGSQGEEYLNSLTAEHPLLQRANVDRRRWDQWLNATDTNLDPAETPFYLLVDQEGYAMMVYTAEVDGNDLLKDLKRALKYSIDYQ